MLMARARCFGGDEIAVRVFTIPSWKALYTRKVTVCYLLKACFGRLGLARRNWWYRGSLSTPFKILLKVQIQHYLILTLPSSTVPDLSEISTKPVFWWNSQHVGDVVSDFRSRSIILARGLAPPETLVWN